jgi:hypothetical protein
LGAAIAGLTLPGAGLFSAFLTATSELISSKIFDAKDPSPGIYALGATLEDFIHSNSDEILPEIFVYQLEKTMRHCGFAY